MSTVEEIVNAIKELPPGEREEVKRRLEALPAQPDENETSICDERQAATDLDQRIQTALYEAGLVSEIKPPITDPTPYRREPITIRGKPLSETVIEERR
ncbi:MAG: hypothetical protein ACR2HX_00670 [Pyrinomonadaceae bacterium]